MVKATFVSWSDEVFPVESGCGAEQDEEIVRAMAENPGVTFRKGATVEVDCIEIEVEGKDRETVRNAIAGFYCHNPEMVGDSEDSEIPITWVA
jgi:hypothetical protein